MNEMERIKEIRQRLRAAVQSSEPGQRRALGRAGRFFAAMHSHGCSLCARNCTKQAAFLAKTKNVYMILP